MEMPSGPPEPGTTTSQVIIRNTAFNALGRFWRIAIGLFLVPYTIGHIGRERYAIWIIVGVLTGYFGMLDFGVGSAFVKFISEAYGQRNYRKVNQVVSNGIVFYAIFSLVVSVSAIFLVDFLLTFFDVPVTMRHEAREVQPDHPAKDGLGP